MREWKFELKAILIVLAHGEDDGEGRQDLQAVPTCLHLLADLHDLFYQLQAKEFADQFLLSPVQLDELGKSLEAIEQREAVVIVLLLENASNIAENLLLAETIEYAEVLLTDHTHVILLLRGRISIQTHFFIDGNQLFELEASTIPLYGLELGVFQHLLYD